MILVDTDLLSCPLSVGDAGGTSVAKKSFERMRPFDAVVEIIRSLRNVTSESISLSRIDELFGEIMPDISAVFMSEEISKAPTKKECVRRIDS